MGKAAVRALARFFGLGDVAELPAQPCLASRIETGIAVDPDDLAFIEAIERWLEGEIGPGDIRCRITAQGVRIELPAGRHAGDLEAALARRCQQAGRRLVAIAPYRRGSAFLHERVPS